MTPEQIRERSWVIENALNYCREYALDTDFDGGEEMVEKCDAAMGALHDLLWQTVNQDEPTPPAAAPARTIPRNHPLSGEDS